MKRRLLNLLTVLSLLLSAAVVALIIACNWRDRGGPYLLSDAGPRLAVYGGKVSAFNRGLPYTGGIIGIRTGGPPGIVSFDFAGVYFRYFRLCDATTWWTLAVPLPYLFALAAVFPGTVADREETPHPARNQSSERGRGTESGERLSSPPEDLLVQSP